MEHATLSPSSSARWLRCTASVEACKPYENRTNPAAAWGTACHALGELMIKDMPHPKTGEMIEGVEIDIEMMNTAIQYADYCRSLMNPYSVTMIEERFDLTFIAPDTFGTGDFTVLNDNELHIVDLKTGHNIVDAEENTQLMLYALGAIHELEDLYDIETVTLHICQTRANHISTWSCDMGVIEQFRNFARKQAKAIMQGETTFVPHEKACKWCDHKADCEALAHHTFDIMQGEFDDLDEIDGQADAISENHMKKILDNKELITSFIKAVEERALEMAQRGDIIKGYKMVRGRKNLAWTDAERAEAYLLRKLKQEGTYKKTLITPTQAKKALGKDNKFIDKLMARPEGALQLAPESDPRESVSPIIDGFDEL